MKMVKNKDNKAVVRSSFMVADFETLVLSSETEQRHVPYAVGVMKVDPGKGLRGEIAWWYSEDYTQSDFEDRSKQMVTKLILYLSKQVTQKWFVIYSHNFSRFDGLLLIRHNVDSWLAI